MLTRLPLWDHILPHLLGLIPIKKFREHVFLHGSSMLSGGRRQHPPFGPYKLPAHAMAVNPFSVEFNPPPSGVDLGFILPSAHPLPVALWALPLLSEVRVPPQWRQHVVKVPLATDIASLYPTPESRALSAILEVFRGVMGICFIVHCVLGSGCRWWWLDQRCRWWWLDQANICLLWLSYT